MKKRFDVLDIFRGIFSVLVVFFHMSAFSDTPVLNNNFIYNSDLFVDFFFVLSGFVIAHSYSSIVNFDQFKAFFQKRIYRLYPLHLIILLLFVLVEFSKNLLASHIHVNKLVNESNNLNTFFTSLFLLNSIKLPGIKDVSWNIASWSISAEMISYLCFGLILLWIGRLRLLKFQNLIFLLVIAMAAFSLFAATKSFELTFSFNYGFLRGLMGFFTGAVCLNLYKKTQHYFYMVKRSWFNLAEISVFLLIIIMIWNGNYLKTTGWVYELLFFTAVFVFSFERGFLSDQFKKPVLLHHLGKYSYSIYMTHTLLLSLFNILFIRILKFPPSAYSYLFLFNFLLIYLVSTQTFKHIEMRFSAGKKSSKAKSFAW